MVLNWRRFGTKIPSVFGFVIKTSVPEPFVLGDESWLSGS